MATKKGVTPRKFQIEDSIFERLALDAIKNKTKVSAWVNRILDQHLPRHSIVTDKSPARRLQRQD